MITNVFFKVVLRDLSKQSTTTLHEVYRCTVSDSTCLACMMTVTAGAVDPRRGLAIGAGAGARAAPPAPRHAAPSTARPADAAGCPRTHSLGTVTARPPGAFGARLTVTGHDRCRHLTSTLQKQ
ncbi:hypothetical protein EVAR_14788_1 [Eumeta japonica]|uniref:Uncharacterized protein n=1 Tax=Eumeta variegata TaxID=151549 RepID=A0A4C1TWG1_EUMVA|nr:hypothetical protein EVAR_14788_1 [Eumeta japonica]